jgi:excisionase family DNA binding protein
MADNALMLTPKDIAEQLGVHQKTVHLWLRTGKLQGVKISYRAWRIPKESFDSFIKANSNIPYKQGTNTGTGSKQQRAVPYQTEIPHDEKEEEKSSSRSKMKDYIRDIMGEQSHNAK